MAVVVVRVDEVGRVPLEQESHDLGRTMAVGIDHRQVQGIPPFVLPSGDRAWVALDEDLKDLAGRAVCRGVVHGKLCTMRKFEMTESKMQLHK